MKAELYKRLFKAIYTEDIVSLKKIAITIIQEERKLGHNVLADSLEKLTITEKPTIKNSLRKKIVTEYEFLRNNPDDTKSRQRLRGLITAARQVDKSAFPNISKFAFDSFHSQ